MATAQTPDMIMLMAMMPGSSMLLYLSGNMPAVVMTRPKTNWTLDMPSAMERLL